MQVEKIPVDEPTKFLGSGRHLGTYAEEIAERLVPDMTEEVDPTGMGFTDPAVLPADDFERLLEDLSFRVHEGDSAEGSMVYAWGDEPGKYKVQAALRIGNSEGQGGVRLINGRTQANQRQEEGNAGAEGNGGQSPEDVHPGH